jgi:hypothetical protein
MIVLGSPPSCGRAKEIALDIPMVEGPDPEMENARGAEQELPALHLHQAPGQECPSSLGGHFLSKCVYKNCNHVTGSLYLFVFPVKSFFKSSFHEYSKSLSIG